MPRWAHSSDLVHRFVEFLAASLKPAADFIPGRESSAADHFFVDDESRQHQNRSIPADLTGIIYLGDGHLELWIGQLEFMLDGCYHPADSIAFGSSETEDFYDEHNNVPLRLNHKQLARIHHTLRVKHPGDRFQCLHSERTLFRCRDKEHDPCRRRAGARSSRRVPR